MAFQKAPIKGMNDFLPAQMRLREKLISQIKQTYRAYGFEQIETPMMEHIENLAGSDGGENEKLIFKVLKRGRDLERALDKGPDALAEYGMRYDLTVPLSRYYAANKEHLPQPFKALQIGNVWRADKPQAGRFRQFTQCDIDILGDDSNLVEIELISATADMLWKIFEGTPATGITIHVNDRRILRAVALDAGIPEEGVGDALIVLDKMDKVGLEGVEKELLAGGMDEAVVESYLASYRDVEAGDCSEFCGNLNPEYFDGAAATNLDEIISCVRGMVEGNITIEFDPTLVRGMGYYTGPIFEVTLDGFGFSIAGGGRYDGMIGKFSGEAAPAAGFSIGFERIVTVLNDFGQGSEPIGEGATAFLVSKKASAEKKIETLNSARELRASGKVASVQVMRKNVKRQIEALEAEGFEEFIRVYDD